jgi:threonine/homoserine/homoserine lactone efflux protein
LAYLFGEGFLIGLLICMPMGAIGMLCLRYILVQGKASGLSAGLGIAAADAVAAFVAALGLTAITLFIKSHETWMHVIGAIILIGFGLYLLLSKKTTEKQAVEKGLTHIFFIMFVITLTNPLTLLSFTGIFAAVGLDTLQSNLLSVFSLSFGVFFGSLAWWVILILGSMFFNINQQKVRYINEFAGTLLIIMGVYSLYAAFLV